MFVALDVLAMPFTEVEATALSSPIATFDDKDDAVEEDGAFCFGLEGI